MESVFITGGTTGIGEALAKYYSEKGYRVGICARGKTKYVENFSEKKYDPIQFYNVDVTNRENVKKAINAISINVAFIILFLFI